MRPAQCEHSDSATIGTTRPAKADKIFPRYPTTNYDRTASKSRRPSEPRLERTGSLGNRPCSTGGREQILGGHPHAFRFLELRRNTQLRPGNKVGIAGMLAAHKTITGQSPLFLAPRAIGVG